jgi:hypothetical protein
MVAAEEPEGLPRDAQADLHPRADGNEGHERGENLRHEGISLVAAVEADLLA